MVTPALHPAFAGFREAVPLSGFSGARVALLRGDDGSSFVRKAAERAEGNAPLRRQAARQAWLRGVLSGAAEVAEVLGEGEADGLYWFDMTLVPGRDATTHLSTAGFDSVERFAGSVRALVERLAGTPLTRGSTSVRAALAGKVAEIDRRTDGAHARLLAPLAEAAAVALPELPATASHGDLTFENIIVDSRERLWLIDTIDSPVDHYWMDWTKLFQECEGRWHLHRRRTLSLSVSWALRQRFLAAAGAMDARYPAFHYLLLGLTFARILPYARDADDVAFVSSRVATFGALARDRLEKTG